MLPPPYRFKSLRLVLTALLTFSLSALWLGHGAGLPTASAQVTPTFKNFEGPQIHPLALTPDGTRLLAVNTPNATLSVFQLTGGTPLLTAEIPVGLEPVSVAARNNREAWVVNWLSDSVSVVDLSTGNVTRTIDVGDEPTDVLFAGLSRELAFVCISGKSQVKVFDPSSTSSSPQQSIDIFGKQPRSLARDASGGRVFVSVFESGNLTTIVPEAVVAANGGLPPPNPVLAAGLPQPPNTGLIVKWNGSAWVDETGKSWSQFLPFRLADEDVMLIDAAGSSPALAGVVRGVGTHNGNMAFDSATNRLFVANLDSTSAVRFEPNLKGRFQSNRITVVNALPSSSPTIAGVFDLNPHVDPAGSGSDAERAQSLALPADLARAADGTLFVAATSSARVGVFDSAGAVQARIAVGQGPTGLALDEGRSLLYVLNRFENTLSVVNTSSRGEVARLSLGTNPEPQDVRDGRKFLYDADLSAHGTVSCASCHGNGHRDGLAWDLGDPRGTMDQAQGTSFHPMKGPMVTQSLRDIVGNAPLHWRGDRSNLAAFNAAFVSLLGGPRQLTADEMASFEAFVRALAYPPNPNEPVDRSMSGGALSGLGFFSREKLDGGLINCSDCHITTNFSPGTNNLIIPAAALKESQAFKVPQLRGLYQKTGLNKTPNPNDARGQITGFGFAHDGTFDTLFNFMKASVFVFRVDASIADSWRRSMTTFMLELDTGTAPTVGMQATVNAQNKTSFETTSRLNLLVRQADARNCDLIVRGIYGGVSRGFQHTGGDIFQPDSLSEAPVSLQQLIDAAGTGAELTFTGVPVGAGRRMGVDRNANNLLDDDEPRTSVSVTGRVVNAAGNGVAGVAVLLSGTQNALTETDALGRYVFNFVSTTGTHTVTPQQGGVSFTPQSRSFANPTWNASASFVTSPAQVSDASRFFVTQHYNDFFSREPDAGGLAFWTNEIEQCGANADCRALKRQNVSAAFFLSIEFKETGFLVYRAAGASFGNLPANPVPVTFQQLMVDTGRIGRNIVVGVGDWQARLESNKGAFFRGWVQRPEFVARFPAGMPAAEFVDALNANTGGSLTTDERNTLVSQLSGGTLSRAGVVQRVAENAEFARRESNKAFVLMQYFGYLRRNPDEGPDTDFRGYNFWLTKLNDNDGNFIRAQMVESFITSIEYRRRFGPQ